MIKDSKKQVRVRIAPSPTGYFHVGTARAALFNYLFAKQNNGVFIFRIEDTDEVRSKKEYEKPILEGLRWLGIEPDEGPDIGGEFGPYRQSERADIYKTYVQKLLDENKAYYCFASKEEVEARREAMLADGQTPVFISPYKDLSKEEALAKVAAGEAHVIRFKMPEGEIKFKDLVRGEISFDGKLIGDFVIARDVDKPLFHLSSVLDDALMKITHAIRGEDLLSNTPRQIALAKAMNFEPPEYGHLPLILDPKGGKLSKRFGATTLEEYKEQGYLPEAMFNFLSLLGWHPKETGSSQNLEKMSREEIIEEFDIARVQKGGAVWSSEKLDWLNNLYIREMDTEELLKLLKKDFIKDDLERLSVQGVPMPSQRSWLKMVELSKERMNKLSDFFAELHFFFKLASYEANDLIWKNSDKERTIENLQSVEQILEGTSPDNFELKVLEEKIMPLAEEKGRGDVLWPLRFALSGQKASPSPFELLDVLGKQESLLRLDLAISNLAASS
ncbi:MAG: glutamate--tRNA ligase [bacterium]|nr:glutamate--tRNA ligase [bacterium]